MDAALAQLLPQIKEALSHDTAHLPQLNTTLSDLLPAIREALQTDQAAAGEDDERIATQVAELIPRLRDGIKQAHADARSLIERDYPWALQPLDWNLDLLTPLGKARNEVMHTQALAYLLDHRANHGLGIRALKEFFSLLGRLIPGEDVFERLSKESEENNERLRHVHIFAERAVQAPAEYGNTVSERRCDIWLELIEEGRSVVCVIENKIDAGEHGSQLAAYEQAVWQWARQNRRLSFDAKLVFLTPEGRPPEGQSDQQLWVAMSYKQLAAALAHAGRDAPEPGRTFLQLYVSSILKEILGVASRVDEMDFVKQLPFMNAVIDQGALNE